MNNYPFNEFIDNRMSELKISRKDLVFRMEFKNIQKGYTRVDDIISGRYPVGNEDRLAKALEVTRETLDKIIVEDKEYCLKLKLAEERKKFKPFICAMMERRIPSPIFAGCMTNKLRYIWLDNDFMILPENEQLAFTQQWIVEHFEKNKGAIVAFGKILHYVMRRDYDQKPEELQLFNTEGERIIPPVEGLELTPGRPLGVELKNGQRLF